MRDLTVEGAVVDAPKRFGTFLGVFTPSILTILGVIMYQRLGWVVGQAGLTGAIAIIVLAHVISIPTGLSVASIATNHTVRTGGNYYIISRSLGLSVGGTIGLALYLALALGVSLYLIGFAEAFIVATGLEPFERSTDNIRLVGSCACFGLAVITFWSTDIAIKSQLFVLLAIVASLVAIVFGPSLVEDVALAPGPAPNAPDFASIFAVFFPAVTGFTAGVGMSGDLRDPKRAIPVGTMAAIACGLIIYLGLAVLLAVRADGDLLRSDYNVLRQLSVDHRLVTLGVFAATLSSALGSMLGAPRTLQALAFDGIVPEWLGRGEGEPRVALGATLLIAESGILLAELDVVGAIITMFFLTCYGFLCLTCGLERWASPDFRPQFKVPIWVSLAGAVACFLVMFQIDALSMFAAIGLMSGTYAVIKRRQLVLGGGDTWGGVWSAVVRMGLMRLQQSASRTAQRNWRPNMLVVGRSRAKNPLVDFGRALVGDRGLLTHVHLVEGEAPRPRQDRIMEEAYPGVFARIQGCEDVYTAVPQLAASFGLAGMETNTVLLGWPREAAQRRRYAHMIDQLLQQDLSVLMLRHDAERGFGKRERIDVWWDGEASTGPLMLTLAYMLSSSPDWKQARVRVLVNGRVGQDDDRARRALEGIIQEARVKAEGVILPPVADSQALANRIRTESGRADLVLIHALEAEDELGFVPANDQLIRPLRTTLLVRPSAFFAQKAKVFDPGTIDLGAVDEKVSVPTPVPQLLQPLQSFETQLSELAERFSRAFDGPARKEEEALLADVAAATEEIRQLERRLERRGDRRAAARGLVEWARSRFTTAVEARLQQPFTLGTESRSTPPWEKRLRDALQRLTEDLADSASKLPERIEVPTEAADWFPASGDGVWTRFRKARIRFAMRWLGRVPPPRWIRVRGPAADELARFARQELDGLARSAGLRRQQVILRVRRLVIQVQSAFDRLMTELDQSSEEGIDLGDFVDVVESQLDGLQDLVASQRIPESESDTVRRLLQERLQSAAAAVALALSGDRVRQRPKEGPPRPVDPKPWAERHQGFIDALRLDVRLEGCTAEARRALATVALRVRREVQAGPIASIERAREVMLRVVELREEYEGSQEATEEELNETPPFTEAFLAAADELRATFDVAYRPGVQELVDTMLTQLARGAERIPMTVIVPTDVAEPSPDPNAGFLALSPRRLLQTFLEQRVVLPARKTLEELPAVVRRSEEALVDAVRLVAFELEAAAAAGREDRVADVEEAGTLALGGTLEERIQRLQQARAELDEVLEHFQRVFFDDSSAVLVDARSVVYGPVAGGKAVRRAAPMAGLLRTARDRVRRASEAAVQRVERLRRTAPRRPRPSTIVDEVLRVRAALHPRPEMQASLPLLYRRVFGRAPLETPDLVVGREAPLAELNTACERWESGVAGPVGVVGAPRSGRTTLLNVWTRALGRPVYRIVPPPGGSAAIEDLNQSVTRAVGAREGQTAEWALRSLAPGAMVVVDDIGAWVERSPDGFAAARALFRLVRRLGERHLFVLSGTRLAFDWLEPVLPVSSLFLSLVRCGSLSATELEAALLLRQRTSDFELELERGSRWWNRRSPLERLHARVRGNVGEAVDVWRRSVTQVTERRISLDITSEPDVSVLERLPLRWNVALTTVVLHRSVTVARMARTFRCGRDEAQSLLSDLQRASLVRSERNATWDLDPVLQGPLVRALRRQGFMR
jgi:amino acid transporter